MEFSLWAGSVIALMLLFSLCLLRYNRRDYITVHQVMLELVNLSLIFHGKEWLNIGSKAGKNVKK